ncbi:MAG: hypothetical protein JWN68_666 [Nocardioides sp.]|jgi:Ca2+-binding RTX toxin-like protein|uniref:HYR domain-containing protein n=1 Tax=Nocardioides sp. TaxID=35761 RepID=UPI0026398F61|nr:HYR domain-containing protein [Nocardioides sp.]MCW2832713.1 hypothetical protein [Nocardioides sp.]
MRVNQLQRRRRTLLSVATICAISLPAAALVAASPSSAEEDKFAQGKKVSQGAVAGDGPVVAQGSGDAELTDGVGATWFLNTNIDYSTTSSMSAAASEASFLNPVVASTEMGGTTVTSLSDAFDGYNSLSTFVGTPVDPEALVPYNELGADPTTSCGGRQLDYPVQTNGPVTVTRSVFVPADAGYARWKNTVTNTSGAAATVTLAVANNLGSDSGTVVFDSSSGDTASSVTDTWVGTFEDYSGDGTSRDPRIGHVLQGKGAPATMIDNVFVNGDDGPFWTHQITVGAGETKSILNYAVLRGSKADAAAAAANIADQTPTACMTHTEANTVANFVVGDAPTLTLPANLQREATGPNGAAVTFSASAVDGNNQPVPVTCTPASGSVFPVGVTTVTCSATDPQGRKSTGTFTVTVTPLPALCEGERATIQAQPGVITTGTPGKDVIVGTSAADTINSLGGNDVICGVGGNDVINAGDGDDMVDGGDGDDNVRGGRDSDEVFGDAGDDVIRGGHGSDEVTAGDGDDTVSGGRDADKVTGDAGNDSIRGGDGNDRVRGNSGKDRVVGNTGDDNVSGGGGKDQLNGNRGDDKVTSGGGADQARGGPGMDTVDGVKG